MLYFCVIFSSMMHTLVQAKQLFSTVGKYTVLDAAAGRRWLSVGSFSCRPFKSVSITSTSHSTIQPPSMQAEQIRWTCHTHSRCATTITYRHIQAATGCCGLLCNIDCDSASCPTKLQSLCSLIHRMGWYKKCCTSLLCSEKQVLHLLIKNADDCVHYQLYP